VSLRTRTSNPFGIHRRSFLGTWLDNRRANRRLYEPPTSGDRPKFVAPQDAVGAKIGPLPVSQTHADVAMRWNVIAVIESLREKTSGGKLVRIDRKIAKKEAQRPQAAERAVLATERFGVTRAARAKLRASAAGREHELESNYGTRAALITACLIVFDASVMVQPWHLFGAPSIPGLSNHQTDASSLFAILRAILLSIVIVLTAKRAGTEIKLQVENRVLAQRVAKIAMLLAVGTTTILLIRSTSEMQSAYLAITSGGLAKPLSANVFLMVMLFVISASLCTGFWLSNALAEQDGRLRTAERRAERAWNRRTKRLRRVEASVAALSVDRVRLLDSLTHLEREQAALEQQAESLMHDENWLLYGVAAQKADDGQVARHLHTLDWIGEFSPDPVAPLPPVQPAQPAMEPQRDTGNGDGDPARVDAKNIQR
jgi:hypothetical protein